MESTSRPGAWKDPAEEAALVARAQRGDRAAFMALVRFYDRSVHRIIYALVRDPDRAAALTHETFMRAWKGIQHIPAGQTFYPWLMRLARGQAISQTRRLGAPVESAPPAPTAVADTLEVIDPAEAARARDCERAFMELGVDLQTILVLRVAERLSYAQIAKTLDIPFAATMGRLATARSNLRTKLQGPGQKAA